MDITEEIHAAAKDAWETWDETPVVQGYILRGEAVPPRAYRVGGDLIVPLTGSVVMNRCTFEMFDDLVFRWLRDPGVHDVVANCLFCSLPGRNCIVVI